MAQNMTDFPAAQPLTTAALVIAVLESRRTYQRALALAKRLLIEGSPAALTWGDDADRATAAEYPTSPHALNRTVRPGGYPAFHTAGIRKGRRNRHGLRVVPSDVRRGVSVPNACE